MPQVCAAPAEIVEYNGGGAFTGTGAVGAVVLPVPSSPQLLVPTQLASWFVTVHTWPSPAVRRSGEANGATFVDACRPQHLTPQGTVTQLLSADAATSRMDVSPPNCWK